MKNLVGKQGVLWEICELQMGSFGIDWYKGEFTVFNHWFAADITTVL